MAITNLWNKANNISFKTKAIGVAVLFATIPVLSTGAFSAWLSANNIIQQEKAQQLLLIRAMNENLARYLSARISDLQNFATMPWLSDAETFAKTPSIERERLLNQILDRVKVYDHLIVLDLKGNPLAASKNSVLVNYGNRDYFQATLSSGKVQTSNVEIDKSPLRSSIYVTIPLLDQKTGKMFGILQGKKPTIGLATVGKTFDDVNLRWFISDLKSKTILAATDQMQGGRSTEDFSTLNESLLKGGIFTTEDFNQYTKQQQLLTHTALASIKAHKNSKLVLTIGKDKTTLAAATNQMILAIALGTLATGGLTAGIGFLLSEKITKYIQRVIKTILASSDEIVDTVQQQEVTVNEQANSAIQTANTVNQLGSFSFQAAEQADESAIGARQALVLAEEGTKAVQETLSEMANLREKVDAIALQIANLSEQTGQISNVSEIVADLAYQTNMLALKAAVEAARAGEQGKGFGVVAGEIRKLADRSKKSAEKINLLANDIQTEINRTVMVTEEGTKTVQAGIELAETTSSTFVGVTTAVNNLFLNSQQISESAKQQAVAIQQVLNAMNSIAQGSQESAVGMFRVKSSTREINQIADELQTALN